MFRTHNCGELRRENAGQYVKIAGWLSGVRDMGAVAFASVRDFYGTTQVVFSEEVLKKRLREIQRESVVCIEGRVEIRSNPNNMMMTGEIEIIPDSITVLGRCTESLPFEVADSLSSREDTRLKYRFLDLRNPVNRDKLVLRSQVIKSVRQRMYDRGFMEIQTPILTSSSPEGARDYIVPSRLHPGKFYALPQAPQQFKQLLMVSGIDKYFQIAPCFRDEDARADRSPGEFYQLDMEMAFAEQEDVFEVIEGVMIEVFNEFSDNGVENKPFPRITYSDAMEMYGSDKPDLRIPLIIKDVSGIFDETSIKFFKGMCIKAVAVKNCRSPRSFFDSMDAFVKENGGSGAAWFKLDGDEQFTGGISRLLSDDEKFELVKYLELSTGDAAILVAGMRPNVVKMAGLVRNEMGRALSLIEHGTYRFCWIVDFPMYEVNEDTNRIEFSHNPFSMPQGGLEALVNEDPLSIKAYQYDIVCNGIELSSGAVRNHDPQIMVKAFEIAGYDEDTVRNRFPALFNAFRYGAPPHAGIAPGIDRMVMVLADEPNIREVIAFPMNKNAQDLLMGAPGVVADEQLSCVHIDVCKDKN